MTTVFLHGFATTPEIWHNQKADWAPQLVFRNIKEEAAKLVKVIGKGEGKGEERGIILIGWSMGGMVAMQAAALAPERLKALILVSTTPKFIQSPEFSEAMPLALLRRLEKRIGREGTKAFHDLVFKNGQTLGLAHLPLAEVEDELRQLEIVDLRPLLPKIKVPTMIIHGENDEICLPGAARYMKVKIQKAKVKIIPNVGHVPMIEAPEKFNAILQEFIDEQVQ